MHKHQHQQFSSEQDITATQERPSSSLKPRRPRNNHNKAIKSSKKKRYLNVAAQLPVNPNYPTAAAAAATDNNNKNLEDPSATATSTSFSKTLKHLERHPALILNADYQPMSFLPLSLWHWQEAVKAIFSGKVTVVDVYPDVTIRAANVQLALPSVLALNDYVPIHKQRNLHKPSFTKKNVFLRDEYRCQYCREQFTPRDLSLDHVVPRCKGGRLTWDNAVTSCKTCNGRKGSLTVDKLSRVNMQLSRRPYVPSPMDLQQAASRVSSRSVHVTWEPYLRFEESTIMTANGDADDDEEHFHEAGKAASHKKEKQK
jgi:5-methylcytosine-specific restriction endonuclease McrA